MSADVVPNCVAANAAYSADAADGTGAAEPADPAVAAGPRGEPHPASARDAVPRRRVVRLQSGDGLCVELSPDAVSLCRFMENVLETVPADEEIVVVPAPMIPGKWVRHVAAFVEAVAADPLVTQLCAFLEERRLRGDFARFVLGVPVLADLVSSLVHRGRWDREDLGPTPPEHRPARLLSMLDYIEADLPLVAAYACWWKHRAHHVDEARGCSGSNGQRIALERFGGFTAATPETRSAAMLAVTPVLVDTPLALAPILLADNGCLEELAVVAHRTDAGVTDNDHFLRSLRRSLPALKRLCVFMRGTDEAASAVWNRLPVGALEGLASEEIVAAPEILNADATRAVVALVEMSACWSAPKKIVITTANVIGKYRLDHAPNERAFVAAVADAAARAARASARRTRGGPEYIVDVSFRVAKYLGEAEYSAVQVREIAYAIKNMKSQRPDDVFYAMHRKSDGVSISCSLPLAEIGEIRGACAPA